MTVKRSVIRPVIFSPIRTPTTLYKGGGAVVPAPTPVAAFIQTHDTGLISTTPTNLRTGLSSSTYSTGGFVEELEIAVTGTNGSAVLTTAETTKVAGLGSNAFEAVLVADDASAEFFVTVYSHNGSTEITLREPLSADFTGTLSAKYDAANGQHLTLAGTKAWARLVANADGTYYQRGRVLGGLWSRRGTYNVGLAVNAALASYGSSNSAAPVVVSSIQNLTAGNILDGSTLRPIRPSTADHAGKYIGTHLAGHGGVYTLPATGVDSVVEFYVAATRSSTNLNGAGVQIDVSVDLGGVEVYAHTQDHVLRRHVVHNPDGLEVVVNLTNTDGAIYYIVLTHLTVREAGTAGPLLTSASKVLVTMDSWGQFYSNTGDGFFEDYLEDIVGCTVYKNSVGGMTSEYSLAWIDTWLAANPDTTHAIYGMNVNDQNNLYYSTFTDPESASQPLWPYNAANLQSAEITRQNVETFINTCIAAGVTPIILMPAGTAASTQAQLLADAALGAEPLTPFEMRCLSAEFTNAHSGINYFGKTAGARHYDTQNSRWMVADGSTPTATWTQEGGGTTVTPVDTTAPVIFSGFSRTQPENSALEFVVSAGEDCTWTKTGGADTALFSLTTIDARSALLELPAQDFETPADADTNNVYVVQVTATDGAANASNRTVSITISNVAE